MNWRRGGGGGRGEGLREEKGPDVDLGDNFQAGWRSAVSDQFMLSTLGAAQKNGCDLAWDSSVKSEARLILI